MSLGAHKLVLKEKFECAFVPAQLYTFSMGNVFPLLFPWPPSPS